MTYATIKDIEDSVLGYDLDNSGNTRPTQMRCKRMLRRADDIINAEINYINNNFLNERTKITCSDKASLSNDNYFHFYVTDYLRGEAPHYIYYDTDGGASDPNKAGTGHSVDISSVSSATDVAIETASVINDIDLVTAWSETEYLYIQNDEIYNATDITDGDTGFTIEVLQDGSNDTGGIKNIAIELVSFMINNMFGFTNPEKYGLKEIELTEDHIRTIHKTYYEWTGNTFELDGR